MVKDSWLTCHEFKPSAVEAPPYRESRCALNLSRLKRSSVGVEIQYGDGKEIRASEKGTVAIGRTTIQSRRVAKRMRRFEEQWLVKRSLHTYKFPTSFGVATEVPATAYPITNLKRRLYEMPLATVEDLIERNSVASADAANTLNFFNSSVGVACAMTCVAVTLNNYWDNNLPLHC
ncbi:hypothetical protein TNCV_79601 [Trichonephila clavipes]|nr:hypothetical protein TNCV_79601 [Trichonephila clavipes]